MIGNNENDKTYICMKVKFYIVFYISSLILYSLILKNKQCIYEKNCNVDSLYGVCSFWIFSV